MNELAVQGANDTNESIDREAINEELEQLTQELDRISTTTQFNKQNLLDGSFSDKNLQVGANADQKIAISIDNMNADALGLRGVEKNYGGDKQTGETITKISYMGKDYTYDTTSSYAANISAAKSQFNGDLSDAYTSDLYASKLDANNAIVYASLFDESVTFGTAASAAAADATTAKTKMADQLDNNIADYMTKSDTEATQATASYTITGRVAVDDYEMANTSITAIQNAINTVSSQRSALGAIQNRLEHTVANLDNVSENTQSAESRIRDTDMASEMVEYSKNNILAQAGQAMLAQANQATQGVLSLLQ
jgi:flagellin